MQCPSTESLLAFGRGLLRGDDAASIQVHLDECPLCRVLVAEAVASEDGGSVESMELAHPPHQHLSPGSTLGRYVVVERIGAGGMGVVYAAHDPELDRRVALKVIRFATVPPSRLAEAQARLLREAQATARVVHPNVVAIHDFGRVHEEVFLAMELVEGTTLGARLRSGRLPWREALELFLQAGRGLAAAHAAGLVHRDFKPDNVLIDREGRVRITDFGLVRIIDGGEAPSARQPSSPVAPAPGAALTQTGTLLGTPGYMSPEQARGEQPDARSDQFSYCVALHEALYGVRPSLQSSPASLTHVERARESRRLQREAGVPDWLHAALTRGLAPEPGARHASMRELLRSLSQEPRSLKRRVLVGVVAASLVVAVGAVLSFFTRPALCVDDPNVFAGIWDTPGKRAVQDALTREPLPYAADAWREVERTLDAYTRDWALASRQACEATRVHGRQTEGMYERQLLCFDQRRKDLSALVEVLGRADAALVQNSVRAVHGLQDISRCSDVQTLAASHAPPRDPASQRRMEDLRRGVAMARARFQAGQPKAALELASALPERLEGLAYPPLQVEVLQVLAEAQARAQQDREATQTLHKVIQTAEAARRDREVAEGWVALVRVASFLKKDADPEDQYANHAAAAVQRLGGDSQLETTLATNLASLLYAKGRVPEAVAQSLRALELARKTYPKGDSRLATPLLGAGQMLGRAGRHAEGLALLKEAETYYTALYGLNHPDLGVVLESIAVQETYVGELESALTHQRRSLLIAERVYGAESLPVASSCHNLGNMLKDLGRYEESVEHYQRAVALREKLLGPEAPKVASSLGGMGQVLRDMGRHREALALHQRALAIREKALGPESPEVAYAMALVGETLLGMNEPRKARPYLERALTLYERGAFGEQVLIVADMKFLLARAMEGEPRESRRALELVRSTLAVYKRFPTARVKETREVESWLAARMGGTGELLRREAGVGMGR
jgi:tetratricopeptide (TPR) repeat protein